MADISWIEICITTVITIIFVFIGCLVLGLQVRSIKNNIASQKTSQESLEKTILNNARKYDSILSNATKNEIYLQDQLNHQNSSLRHMNRFVNTIDQEQSNIRRNMNINTIQTTNALNTIDRNLTDYTSGVKSFPALDIGSTYMRTQNGNFTINTGSNNVVFNSSNVSLPMSGACIQLGNNTICNKENGMNVSGKFSTSNMNIGNLQLSSKNGRLTLMDSNGISQGINVNGIKQTMPGSMIDYNGYGIGEYENGVMRTYAPLNNTSKLSMGFQNTDSSFQDVMFVQKTGMTVNGDVNISGKITNPQLQNAITQSRQAITIANNVLTTLQETKHRK